MSFAQKATDFAQKHPDWALAGLGGLGMGGILGTLPYWEPQQKEDIHKQVIREGLKPGTKKFQARFEEVQRTRAIVFGLLGGSIYGGMGFAAGRAAKNNRGSGGQREYSETYKDYWREQYRRQQQYRPRPPMKGPDISTLRTTLGLSGSEKTKDEVKKKFRDLAMKHHPDRGGDINKMKNLNQAWTQLQKHDWFNKLAFYRGFFHVSL